MPETQLIQQPPLVTASSLPKRVFGKTGQEVPILGLGTAPCGLGLSDSLAITIIHSCYAEVPSKQASLCIPPDWSPRNLPR